jgi:hypothetical protein
MLTSSGFESIIYWHWSVRNIVGSVCVQHQQFKELVMRNKGKKGPRIIDVGEPEDPDGSPDLSDCISSTQQHFSCDGPSFEQGLLARSHEGLPAETPLTDLIPLGERRY